MVGEVLSDRYELEELVGTGGMSSVYRAHDRLLDRKVALKVLHEQYMADDEYVERFRREARSRSGHDGARAWDADRTRALLRASAGSRAPRREAAERAAERRRSGQGDGLRHR